MSRRKTALARCVCGQGRDNCPENPISNQDQVAILPTRGRPLASTWRLLAWRSRDQTTPNAGAPLVREAISSHAFASATCCARTARWCNRSRSFSRIRTLPLRGGECRAPTFDVDGGGTLGTRCRTELAAQRRFVPAGRSQAIERDALGRGLGALECLMLEQLPIQSLSLRGRLLKAGQRGRQRAAAIVAARGAERQHRLQAKLEAIVRDHARRSILTNCCAGLPGVRAIPWPRLRPSDRRRPAAGIR